MTNTVKIFIAVTFVLLGMLVYQMHQNNLLSEETIAAKQKLKDTIEQFERLKQENRLFTDSLQQEIDEATARWEKALQDTSKTTKKYVQIHADVRALPPDEQVTFTKSRLPKEDPYK